MLLVVWHACTQVVMGSGKIYGMQCSPDSGLWGDAVGDYV